MPWKISDEYTSKFIFPNCSVTIGRINCDINFNNDKSISRKHAEISWVDGRILKVMDFSRFGTFVNGKQIEKLETIAKNGEVIKFGIKPGKDMILNYISFNVLCSCLSNQVKAHLCDYLFKIGGKMSSGWDESVDYLVMRELKVTYKVICALIKQVRIVNFEFVKNCFEYYTGLSSEEPHPKDFIPEIKDDDTLKKLRDIQLGPIPARQTLFKGLTFYFFSESKLENLRKAVESAGGCAKLLVDATETIIGSEGSLIMYDFWRQKQQIDKKFGTEFDNEQIDTYDEIIFRVYSILKQFKRRPIIDSEIGFAVLYCSLAEYCNPTLDCPQHLYRETELSHLSASESSLFRISRNSWCTNDSERKGIVVESVLPNSLTKLTKDNFEIDKQRKDNFTESVTYSKEIKHNPLQHIYNECHSRVEPYNKAFNKSQKSPLIRNLNKQTVNSNLDDEFDKIMIPSFGSGVTNDEIQMKIFDNIKSASNICVNKENFPQSNLKKKEISKIINVPVACKTGPVMLTMKDKVIPSKNVKVTSLVAKEVNNQSIKKPFKKVNQLDAENKKITLISYKK